MPSRNLTIPIEAEFKDDGFKSAAKSASIFEKELAKLERQQARVDRAHQQLGRNLLTGSAAIAAGLALATKAAVSWESAWAGVTKTVEGTPEQMAALEQELRGLTKVLPATHEEIAGVAEAAGQLGIKREDIVEFTETMIALGVSTNLAAQDAATGLARLMNIMGTSADQVDNLGSSLVALGNAGASTEQEILDMALRIAGAGRVIGLTEGEVLGFANALSSVGIEAEAGGSAISTTFVKIESAVQDGGEELDKFAQVAGMTAGQFKTAYERDAAGAIVAFIQGLARMQATGGNVFATLEDLGLGSIRVRQTLLGASAASDQLADSLKLGNQSFAENTALQEEADKRFQTTAARLKIAANAVTDFAIDIGNVLLPALKRVADVGGDVADVFGSLPGPVKEAAAMLALATVAMTGLSGAALVALPRIAATKAALDTLGLSAVGVSARLGAVGLALATLPALIGALNRIIQAATESGDSWFDRLKGVNKEIIDTVDPTDKLSQALGLNKEKTDAAAAATDAAKKEQQDFKDALADATPKITDQTSALDDLNTALDELYGQLFDVEAAQDAFSSSVKDGVARAKDAKLSNLDLRDSGRNLVDQAYKIIEAQAKQGSSTDRINATTKTLKQRIYDAMIQMGASKAEARRYAGALDDVPDRVGTSFATPGLAGSSGAVSGYLRQLRTIPGSVTTYVNTVFTSPGRGGGRAILHEGGLAGFQAGGPSWMSHRPGPHDDIPAMLARGEYVEPRESVDYYGVAMMEAIRTRSFPRAMAPGTPATSVDVSFDDRRLERALTRALANVTVVMDGKTVGRMTAREADLYARGG